MRNMRSLILGCSVVLLTVVAVMGQRPAPAPDRNADREEINALMWKYARALDGHDPDAYAAAYTKDGEFRAGAGNPTKGTQALKALVQNLKDNDAKRVTAGETIAPMYHMTTDSWTEFVDATHAKHYTYWLTVFGAAGRGSTVNVAAAGRGVDDLVKADGKWLIQVRNVAPQN